MTHARDNEQREANACHSHSARGTVDGSTGREPQLLTHAELSCRVCAHHPITSLCTRKNPTTLASCRRACACSVLRQGAVPGPSAHFRLVAERPSQREEGLASPSVQRRVASASQADGPRRARCARRRQLAAAATWCFCCCWKRAMAAVSHDLRDLAEISSRAQGLTARARA